MRTPRRVWIVTLEAADLLGCTPTYVRALAVEGRVVAENAAGTWLFYEPSIHKFAGQPVRPKGRRQRGAA